MGDEKDMGQVRATIRVTNETDFGIACRASGASMTVRSEQIDALVDTGATTLALPADVVARLGVPVVRHRRVRMANGAIEELPVTGGVRVEILGRDTVCDAFVLPEGTPALIGQIPLEALDLTIDPKTRELRVNPASPDVPLLDLLAVA